MNTCTSEKKIRLGIIGTNFVSDWLTEEAQKSGLYEVCAVYSRKMETGETYAAKHAIPVVYTDMEAFLSDPTLDAVYISSPNACHAAQTIDALRHGKHVLCEKPIATSSAEYREMRQAAREHGKSCWRQCVRHTIRRFWRFGSICPRWGRFAGCSLNFASIPHGTIGSKPVKS